MILIYPNGSPVISVDGEYIVVHNGNQLIKVSHNRKNCVQTLECNDCKIYHYTTDTEGYTSWVEVAKQKHFVAHV